MPSSTYVTVEQVLPTLRPAGGELQGPCPAHGGTRAFYLRPIAVDGKEPDPRRPEGWHGLFVCFSCGYRGRVHSGVLVPSGEPIPAGVVPRAEVLAAAHDRDEIVPTEVSNALAAVFGVLQELYPGSEAEAYAARRCLGPLEGAGYMPDTDFCFPSSLDIALLAGLGLIHGDGRPRASWARRLVLPYTWIANDGAERVTTLYGRSVRAPTPGLENHFYTRGHLDPDAAVSAQSQQFRVHPPRWFRGVYNAHATAAADVRLVEGALDAVAAHELGMENVCALGGTSNASLLRPGALRDDATVWWSLDRDRKWAREQAGTAADAALRSLPRKSIYRRYREVLGDRLILDLPPPLRSADGTLTKDWADVCTVVFGDQRPTPTPLTVAATQRAAVARQAEDGMRRSGAMEPAVAIALDRCTVDELLTMPPTTLLGATAARSTDTHLERPSG